jgi:hypothetical protein
MSIKFVVQPTELATMLKNVLAFTKEIGKGKKGSPDILLQVDREGRAGTAAAIGFARYAAARDWTDVMGVEGDEVAQVLVRARAEQKSDVIDDLHKLAMAIDKTSKAKGAQVFVEIHHRQKITVEYGGELVGELADSGASTQPHEAIDELLERTDWSNPPGPKAFLVETMARLKDVKSVSPVVDMAQLPGNEDVVALQVGDSFIGVIGTVDRDVFAAGGPWGDGPGTPGRLLTGSKASNPAESPSSAP